MPNSFINIENKRSNILTTRKDNQDHRMYQTCFVHPLRPFSVWYITVTFWDDLVLTDTTHTNHLKPKRAFCWLVKYCSFDMTRSIGVKMLEKSCKIMPRRALIWRFSTSNSRWHATRTCFFNPNKKLKTILPTNSLSSGLIKGILVCVFSRVVYNLIRCCLLVQKFWAPNKIPHRVPEAISGRAYWSRWG